MASFTYRGSVEALQGTQWEVPDSIPLTQKAAWIESAARQAELEAAAQEEQQAREAEVLAARLEKAKNDASIEKLTSESAEQMQYIKAGIRNSLGDMDYLRRYLNWHDVMVLTETDAYKQYDLET